MKLQALEVGLELAYLGAVSVHRIVLDVTCLTDLVNDDLGVVVSDEPLDSQGNSDSLSVDQSLILGTIIGYLVVDLHDIFQVIAQGRDEKYVCACAFKVQGTIEVHLPVLWLLRQWGLLGLCPLRAKSARIWDLMACRGQNSSLNFPSSTNHLTMRSVVSRLCRISPKGKLETTLTLCDWK
jgi:hypothetical protein